MRKEGDAGNLHGLKDCLEKGFFEEAKNAIYMNS